MLGAIFPTFCLKGWRPTRGPFATAEAPFLRTLTLNLSLSLISASKNPSWSLSP